MRIALLTGSFLPVSGGREWKVHFLASEYLKRGHEVVVFASQPPPNFKRVPLQVQPRYELIRGPAPRLGMGRLGIMRWMMSKRILREHCRRPIDVMHSHHFGYPTAWGVAVRKQAGIPLVATPSGEDVMTIPELGYGDRLKPRFERLCRTNARHIDVIGSSSRGIQKFIETLNPVGRITDIPNGVDWESFQACRTRSLRNRLQLEDNAILILSVGRNHYVKNFVDGLRAFAESAKQHPGIYYAIVGRNVTSLKETAARLRISDRVFLIEQVPMDDMPAIMHSADIFFNPSMIEGFAQVNAQALAAGLPCVITDAPGNVDAADFGGALVVQNRDVPGMSRALVQLVSNPMERFRLADQARQAGRHYAWEAVADRYLRVFETLVRLQPRQH